MVSIDIQNELRVVASEVVAQSSRRFFKLGEGQYGFGDKFIGVTVPVNRSIVKKYLGVVGVADAERLLESRVHEDRLAGVLVLVALYKQYPKEVFDVYMRQVGKGVNNWDLVDTSAYRIVGPYLSDHMEHEERLSFVNSCIASDDLWVRRVIIVASFFQICKKNEKLTFYIAERLLDDNQDLIHKAAGWMLREVGKKVGEGVLRDFLEQFGDRMPRVMYRYAIEKLK